MEERRDTGLSGGEARHRLPARRVEPEGDGAYTRSYGSIVRANVFTLFNVVLISLGALTLVFGAWQDAIFLGIVAANSFIGIVQEMRAKRSLDRLSALIAPTARVKRDDSELQLHRSEVVEGDLIMLAPGDQLIADGVLAEAASLMIDESVVTGESEPVPQAEGATLHSGTFVAEGTGSYHVTAIGPASYAGRIMGEARSFRHPRSPLERATNRLLTVLVATMVPLGALLGAALWERNEPISSAVATAVAAVVSLVPEGLILLTSTTCAVSAIRMARRGALAQQLNAIESIASVDTLCIDKTGTLTSPNLRIIELIPAHGHEQEIEAPLGQFAASASFRNATLAAVAERFPAEARPPTEETPFSSSTRWSSIRWNDTTWMLAAPEHFDLGELAQRVRDATSIGRRVVAFGTTEHLPPRTPTLWGIVILAEDLRPNVQTTVKFLQQQDIRILVLSGDHPATVASIAQDAGITSPTQSVLDGRTLPATDAALDAVLADAHIIGRIAPSDKRRVVQRLTSTGRYVAMVGDGVNDVPALKQSRLAIAPGSAVQMARSVADLVLIHGDFEAVPRLIREGRRIMHNLQQVTRLFVTKSVVAAFLILVIGIAPTSYPLLPRHLSIVAALAVAIPSFVLALAPANADHVSFTRFHREVANFAVPAGTAIGLGVVASFLAAHEVADLSLMESRTVATSVMLFVSLYLVGVLEGAGRYRLIGIFSMSFLLGAAYVGALTLPGFRSFFQLAAPSLPIALIVIGGCAVSIGGLLLSSDGFIPRTTTRTRTTSAS